jgi:hypothetical protein
MNKKVFSMLKIMFLAVLACAFIAAGGGAANLSGKKVLIIAGKDRLSDPVVSKINGLLREEGVTVKISNKSDLKGADAGAYNAVFIVNPIRQGKTERSVTVFADESVQKKIVLFNAVGSRYWVTKEGDKSIKLAGSLFEKIKEVLENN